MKRSIATGVLSVFGGKAAMFVVTMVTTPILVRLLGSGGYGDYAFVMSVFAMLMIFVSSGIADGVRKFIAEERDTPDWESYVAGFYFRHALLVALAAAGLVALIAATGAMRLILDESMAVYFYLIAAMIVAAQFREYAKMTLMGFGKEHYSEALRVTRNLVFAVAGIGLVYLGYGVAGVLVGQLLASSVVVVAGLLLVSRYVSFRYVFRRVPSDFPRREMYTFNSFTIVFILFLTSLYHVDLLMLRPMAGSEQTGYYKGALKLAEFLWFAPIALQTVFLHSTSKMWSNDQTEKITELAARTTRFTLLLTALLAIGLGSLAHVAVPLYFGAEFEPAVVPLLLLLPGALGFAVARPIFAIGQGKGDMRVLVAATGGAAALNLVLNLLLIPIYGMHGAAVATSIGYGSMLVVHVMSARVIGFDPIRDLRPVRVTTTIVVAAVAIVALSRALDNPYLALAIVPPVGFLVFAALAFATGAVDRAEVAEVVASLPLPDSLTNMSIDDSANLSTEQFEKVLMVLGVVLLVAALVLASPAASLLGMVGGGDDGGDDGAQPTEAAAETPTPIGTTEPGEPSPTAEQTDTPTPTEEDDDGFTFPGSDDGEETETPEETPTPTEEETPTPTEEDDGFTFPGNDTPTPTDSSTPTPTPTDSSTPTPTPTDSSTPTPTPTDSSTPTPTPTDSSTPTPTPTDSSTSTSTSASMFGPIAWLFDKASSVLGSALP